MTQNVIVLSAKPYSITNEKTGEVENEGCTVRYIMTETMQIIEDKKNYIAGYVPAKADIPIVDYEKVKIAPAIYEAELDFSVDSKGKAAIKVMNFKFICGITVNRTAVNAKINLNVKEV